MSSLRLALVGAPNCGKSTLFNGLTGGRAKAANYPGVTVETRSGRFQTAGGNPMPANPTTAEAPVARGHSVTINNTAAPTNVQINPQSSNIKQVNNMLVAAASCRHLRMT